MVGSITRKLRVSLPKITRERGIGFAQPLDLKSTTEIRFTHERAGAGAQRTLIGGLWASANQGGADRPDPAAGARVRGRVGNSRIWIGGLRSYLL
jgi:hypothetical protein